MLMISNYSQTDIVERFDLALMLGVVAFRNLIELSGPSFSFNDGIALPKSFGWFRGNNVLWTISYVSVNERHWLDYSSSNYVPTARADSNGVGDDG